MISLAPRCFGVWAGRFDNTRDRIENLIQWCSGGAHLYPFFWIDPTEEDALDQVSLAVDAGVAGFKCICSRFYPGDERAMAVYRAIAAANKPLLFHSGILFDAQDSSRYNRPAEFESLVDIPGLRFALAHMSWPWCDELIAVFGKFQAAARQKNGETAQMFIDTTPGTPSIYRDDAFRKLFTVGYDVQHRVMLGSDQTAATYKPERLRNLIAADTDRMRNLGLGDEVIADVMGGNLRRFLNG